MAPISLLKHDFRVCCTIVGMCSRNGTKIATLVMNGTYVHTRRLSVKPRPYCRVYARCIPRNVRSFPDLRCAAKRGNSTHLCSDNIQMRVRVTENPADFLSLR